MGQSLFRSRFIATSGIYGQRTIRYGRPHLPVDTPDTVRQGITGKFHFIRFIGSATTSVNFRPKIGIFRYNSPGNASDRPAFRQRPHVRPRRPASGPRSMTQSAHRITSMLCSTITTVCPRSINASKALQQLSDVVEAGVRSSARQK